MLQDIPGHSGTEEEKEAIVDGLSHELLEPVTAIVGWADFLRGQDNRTVDHIEGLETIFQRGQQLAWVIKELLDGILLDEVDFERGFQPLAIEDILRTAAASDVLPDASHKLRWDIAKNLPEVLADRQMLTTVVRNLIHNAAKHGPVGTMITVSARHDSPNGQVVVGVSDEGTSLRFTGSSSVFRQYRGGEVSAGPYSGGFSYGLYVSKQLITHMRGDIWVESRPDIGITFYFSLPNAAP